MTCTAWISRPVRSNSTPRTPATSSGGPLIVSSRCAQRRLPCPTAAPTCWCARQTDSRGRPCATGDRMTRAAPVSFSADGQTLYIVGSHDANTVRLLALDVATGVETVMAEDHQYDVGNVFIHPTTRVLFRPFPSTATSSHGRCSTTALPQISRPSRSSAKDEFTVSSRTLDDHTWLISYTTDDGPVYYYAYDRGAKTSTLLFSHRPKLEGLALAPMQPISYQARDGLTIHGYLTTAGRHSARRPCRQCS